MAFRYDSLIREHRPSIHAGGEAHAVGCNLGWEQLFHSMVKYNRSLMKAVSNKHGSTEDEHHTTGAWATRRCDVIVSAFDSAVLRSAAIPLLQELWANGIHAELGKNITGQETLAHQYKHDGASWIVTVKPGIVSGERTLKIRSLITKQDVELKSSELITWLKAELTERDRKSFSADRSAPAKLHRHLTSEGGIPRLMGDEMHLDMDVRILAPDRKNRKVNRTSVIESSQRVAAEISSAYLKRPIAAIDVKVDILEGIKLISLQDTEGWKRLVQSTPAPERKYVQEVQELLEQIKSEGHKECWVYSWGTGKGGIVHLQA